MIRRLTAVVVAILLSIAAPAVQAAPASQGVNEIAAMLNSLKVRPESSTGYSRGRFDDWTTRNSCDTRQWVLIKEARGGKQSGCRMVGARWWSYLDGATTRNPSTFDIDHTVPLHEVWGSGAKQWNRAKRDAYANDLGYSQTLIAVSASSNRSKGDRSPGEWLPPRAAATCRLVQAWISVKWRWRLSVDQQEKSSLARLLAPCAKRVVPLPKRAVQP